MTASIVGFHSGVRMDAGTGKCLEMLLKPHLKYSLREHTVLCRLHYHPGLPWPF